MLTRQDLLHRLNRSIIRLNEFEKLDAPAVVIKVELNIIQETSRLLLEYLEMQEF